ncbi:MAG TPA: bifunctional oligoribonuclease/PAP phosphatase NrnA [Verrucomicrobiae bacterium]|nr:bifunctional oligoribonuclease/PAP phosphatase NrnA [Verrucomicrobiae bacterium]
MSRVDWAPLVDRISRARRIVLTTHINADGDGLGCEIALREAIAAKGRGVVVINNESVPARFRFLRGSETVEAFRPDAHAPVLADADLVIVIDNSSVERLARLRPAIESSRAVRACIDHHSLINPYWTLNCVDVEACASGELVHELIRRLDVAVTPSMAAALYVSIISDTGYFRFAKTTAASHRLAAGLIEIGGLSPAAIHTELYERLSLAISLLTGLAMRSLALETGGRVAWMKLLREDVVACGGEAEDTGDLANLALAIDGVSIGLLFREMGGGETKVSLRSKGSLDVHAVAADLGGGGHRNAAGVLMNAPLDRVIQIVLGRVAEILPGAVTVPIRGGRAG